MENKKNAIVGAGISGLIACKYVKKWTSFRGWMAAHSQSFATLDAEETSGSKPAEVSNLAICGELVKMPKVWSSQSPEISREEVLGKSVNGTCAGIRGRTTGDPQNHWFGPAGDPLGAGIGTPEAIKLVWSCHREVIYDIGPLPSDWELPPST